MIKKVSCFGAGYVGGPTMAVMAAKCPEIEFVVFDINQAIIDQWNQYQIHRDLKKLPVFEQGLDVQLNKCINNNLIFTTDLTQALKNTDIAFIAVNTPSKCDGEYSGLDISYIKSCVHLIQKFNLTKELIIVEKSTVPVKTSDEIKAILRGFQIEVVSNPEFLAEGTAIHNLLNPDRVIIGGNENAVNRVASIYRRWIPEDKIIITKLYSAELSKIVSNAFLAQRISSINSISALCDELGSNINEVSHCIGSDQRIGNKFLQTSIGFGGSCLKKDLQCLIYLCESLKLDEVAEYWKQVLKMNEYQKKRFSKLIMNKIGNELNQKVITILGISFKANTNDTRDSAALQIIQDLQQEQITLRLYDPLAQLPEKYYNDRTTQHKSLQNIFTNSNAIVILTEWDEFKTLNYQDIYQEMIQPAYIFDGRNILNMDLMKKNGYQYYGLGVQ